MLPMPIIAATPLLFITFRHAIAGVMAATSALRWLVFFFSLTLLMLFRFRRYATPLFSDVLPPMLFSMPYFRC